jgi:hypothetical protein
MKSPARGTSGPQFLKNVGYVCRHPEKRDLALQMEYSNRSGGQAVSSAIQQTANRFFAGIRLSDVNI